MRSIGKHSPLGLTEGDLLFAADMLRTVARNCRLPGQAQTSMAKRLYRIASRLVASATYVERALVVQAARRAASKYVKDRHKLGALSNLDKNLLRSTYEMGKLD
jgi:hypothetical protein